MNTSFSGCRGNGKVLEVVYCSKPVLVTPNSSPVNITITLHLVFNKSMFKNQSVKNWQKSGFCINAINVYPPLYKMYRYIYRFLLRVGIVEYVY